MQAVLTNKRTMAIHFCVLFGIAEVSLTSGISRHRIRRDDPISNRSKSSRRVALASAIGTTIEWYDFVIYGTAAAVAPAVLSPQVRRPLLVRQSTREAGAHIAEFAGYGQFDSARGQPCPQGVRLVTAEIHIPERYQPGRKNDWMQDSQ
jgi:hypothetical protein